MNSLRKNFNEYIQIMDNHDMYNESVINIDSCNFLTPRSNISNPQHY